MVTKEELARIRAIVERACADQFGKREGDLTLDGWTTTATASWKSPSCSTRCLPNWGGRRCWISAYRLTVKWEGELLIDTLFRFHLRTELEEAMRE